MSTRRVPNLPAEIINTGMAVRGRGVTETTGEPLAQVQHRRFYERAAALRGKIVLSVDVDEARGRSR
jgi:hypothetical protein